MLKGSFLLISSFAFLASSRALAAWYILASIDFSSFGFSSKNSESLLFKLDSTIPFTSDETNLSLVCDENFGSDILTDIIADSPSLESSPVTSTLSFDPDDCFDIKLLTVFVREALKPDKCVPPSF